MITEIFIYLFSGIALYLLSLLPANPEMPSEITSGISAFGSYFNMINSFFPVDTLLVVLGLWLSFEVLIFKFVFAHFLFKKVRGSG